MEAAHTSPRLVPALKRDLFEHDLFGKPVATFPDHALATSRGGQIVAGLSCTDSPQPQAPVWFGLLNTKVADILSTL